MFQYHWQKSTRVSKNAEFDADFEFVEKFEKKITPKSYKSKFFAQKKVISRNFLHIPIKVKKKYF
jgi:hypothetical protein